MSSAGDGDSAGQSAEQRAEEMVSNMSRVVTRSVFTFVARAREELEDMWAEAQSLRREQSSSEQPR